MPSFRSRTYESVLGATPVVDGARVRTDLDWKEQVQYLGKPTNISASIDAGSMIHADGHFLCLGDNGHLLWLDCSPVGTPVVFISATVIRSTRYKLIHCSSSPSKCTQRSLTKYCNTIYHVMILVILAI